MFEQGPQFRRFDMLRRNVSAARHLQGGRQVGQHHAQRFLMLTQCRPPGSGSLYSAGAARW